MMYAPPAHDTVAGPPPPPEVPCTVTPPPGAVNETESMVPPYRAETCVYGGGPLAPKKLLKVAQGEVVGDVCAAAAATSSDSAHARNRVSAAIRGEPAIQEKRLGWRG